MFASESVALEGTNHTFERNLEPGEAVFVDLDGIRACSAMRCSTSVESVYF